MEEEKKAKTEKGWSVRRVGAVTFAISKPKRNPHKLRQARVRNRRRAR